MVILFACFGLISGLAGQHHGASIECMGCNKSIRNGNVTVQAPRIGEDVRLLILLNECYINI